MPYWVSRDDLEEYQRWKRRQAKAGAGAVAAPELAQMPPPLLPPQPGEGIEVPVDELWQQVQGLWQGPEQALGGLGEAFGQWWGQPAPPPPIPTAEEMPGMYDPTVARIAGAARRVAPNIPVVGGLVSGALGAPEAGPPVPPPLPLPVEAQAAAQGAVRRAGPGMTPAMIEPVLPQVQPSLPPAAIGDELWAGVQQAMAPVGAAVGAMGPPLEQYGTALEQSQRFRQEAAALPVAAVEEATGGSFRAALDALGGNLSERLRPATAEEKALWQQQLGPGMGQQVPPPTEEQRLAQYGMTPEQSQQFRQEAATLPGAAVEAAGATAGAVGEAVGPPLGAAGEQIGAAIAKPSLTSEEQARQLKLDMNLPSMRPPVRTPEEEFGFTSEELEKSRKDLERYAESYILPTKLQAIGATAGLGFVKPEYAHLFSAARLNQVLTARGLDGLYNYYKDAKTAGIFNEAFPGLEFIYDMVFDPLNVLPVVGLSAKTYKGAGQAAVAAAKEFMPKAVQELTPRAVGEAARAAGGAVRALPGAGLALESTPAVSQTSANPWQMTREAFRQSGTGNTNAYIAARTGAKTPQQLLDWYIQKYPELDGVELGGLTATKQSGPLTNDGLTKLVFDDGKLNSKETLIGLTKDADLTVTRHEIEHVLDALHGKKVEPQTFSRYPEHGKFNTSDYLHRSLVRDAVSEGKPVPQEVLNEYPDLAKGASTTPPRAVRALPEAGLGAGLAAPGAGLELAKAAPTAVGGAAGAAGGFLYTDPSNPNETWADKVARATAWGAIAAGTAYGASRGKAGLSLQDISKRTPGINRLTPEQFNEVKIAATFWAMAEERGLSSDAVQILMMPGLAAGRGAGESEKSITGIYRTFAAVEDWLKKSGAEQLELLQQLGVADLDSPEAISRAAADLTRGFGSKLEYINNMANMARTGGAQTPRAQIARLISDHFEATPGLKGPIPAPDPTLVDKHARRLVAEEGSRAVKEIVSRRTATVKRLPEKIEFWGNVPSDSSPEEAMAASALFAVTGDPIRKMVVWRIGPDGKLHKTGTQSIEKFGAMGLRRLDSVSTVRSGIENLPSYKAPKDLDPDSLGQLMGEPWVSGELPKSELDRVSLQYLRVEAGEIPAFKAYFIREKPELELPRELIIAEYVYDPKLNPKQGHMVWYLMDGDNDHVSDLRRTRLGDALKVPIYEFGVADPEAVYIGDDLIEQFAKQHQESLVGKPVSARTVREMDLAVRPEVVNIDTKRLFKKAPELEELLGGESGAAEAARAAEVPEPGPWPIPKKELTQLDWEEYELLRQLDELERGEIKPLETMTAPEIKEAKPANEEVSEALPAITPKYEPPTRKLDLRPPLTANQHKALQRYKDVEDLEVVVNPANQDMFLRYTTAEEGSVTLRFPAEGSTEGLPLLRGGEINFGSYTPYFKAKPGVSLSMAPELTGGAVGALVAPEGETPEETAQLKLAGVATGVTLGRLARGKGVGLGTEKLSKEELERRLAQVRAEKARLLGKAEPKAGAAVEPAAAVEPELPAAGPTAKKSLTEPPAIKETTPKVEQQPKAVATAAAPAEFFINDKGEVYRRTVDDVGEELVEYRTSTGNWVEADSVPSSFKSIAESELPKPKVVPSPEMTRLSERLDVPELSPELSKQVSRLTEANYEKIKAAAEAAGVSPDETTLLVAAEMRRHIKDLDYTPDQAVDYIVDHWPSFEAVLKGAADLPGERDHPYARALRKMLTEDGLWPYGAVAKGRGAAGKVDTSVYSSPKLKALGIEPRAGAAGPELIEQPELPQTKTILEGTDEQAVEAARQVETAPGEPPPALEQRLTQEAKTPKAEPGLRPIDQPANKDAAARARMDAAPYTDETVVRRMANHPRSSEIIRTAFFERLVKLKGFSADEAQELVRQAQVAKKDPEAVADIALAIRQVDKAADAASATKEAVQIVNPGVLKIQGGTETAEGNRAKRVYEKLMSKKLDGATKIINEGQSSDFGGPPPALDDDTLKMLMDLMDEAEPPPGAGAEVPPGVGAGVPPGAGTGAGTPPPGAGAGAGSRTPAGWPTSGAPVGGGRGRPTRGAGTGAPPPGAGVPTPGQIPGTPPPPTPPGARENLLPKPKPTDAILGHAYKEDWLRKVAETVPGLKGPAAAAGIALRDIVTKVAIIHHAFISDWYSGLEGSMARLKVLGYPVDTFKLDKETFEGWFKREAAHPDFDKYRKAGTPIPQADLDTRVKIPLEYVLAHRDRYVLTDKQRQWAEMYEHLTLDKNERAEQYLSPGAKAAYQRMVDAFQDKDPGAVFVVRRLMGRLGPDGKMEFVAVPLTGRNLSSVPGSLHERKYNDVAQALADGFRYYDPLEALGYELKAFGRYLATDRVANFLVSDPEFAAHFSTGERTFEKLRMIMPRYVKPDINVDKEMFELVQSALGITPAASATYSQMQPMNGFLVTVSAFNSMFRKSIATLDVGMLAINLFAYMYSHPGGVPGLKIGGRPVLRPGGVNAMAWGLLDAIDPKFRDKALFEHLPTIQEMHQYGVPFKSSDYGISQMGIDELSILGRAKLTEVGNALGKTVFWPAAQLFSRFERMYDTVLDMARVYAWESLRHPGMTEEQLFDLGAHVTDITGGFDTGRRGVGRYQRMLETVLLFAPRYNRSAVNLVTHFLSSGEQGDQARWAIMKMLGFGGLMYLGSVLALEEMGYPQTSVKLDYTRDGFAKYMRALVDERLNPRKPGDYMGVTIEDQRLAGGGAYVRLVRLGENLAQDPGKAHEHFAKYFRSMGAPVTSAIGDIVLGSDLAGRRIVNVGDMTTRLTLGNLIPAYLQYPTSKLTQDTDPVQFSLDPFNIDLGIKQEKAEAATSALFKLHTLANFAGLRGLEKTPAKIRDEDLKESMTKLGDDPDLESSVSVWRARNANTPEGRKAWESYINALEEGKNKGWQYHKYTLQELEKKNERMDQRDKLFNTRMDEKIGGDEFREQMSKIDRDEALAIYNFPKEYWDERAQIEKFALESREEENKKRAERGEKSIEKSKEQLFLDLWYNISRKYGNPQPLTIDGKVILDGQGKPRMAPDRYHIYTAEQLEAISKERATLIEMFKYEPNDPVFEYIYRKYDQHGRGQYKSGETPALGRNLSLYIQGLQQYRKYLEIPKYLGLTPAQARIADDVKQSIADLNRRWKDTDIAQIKWLEQYKDDPEKTKEARENFRLYLLAKGRGENPARERFRMLNPLMTLFFSGASRNVPGLLKQQQQQWQREETKTKVGVK